MNKVLIVLYEGFTEYEFQIPVLALDHYQVPFEVVGVDAPHVSGMMGLSITLSKTLADVNPDAFGVLFLPGVDSSMREKLMSNEQLLDLVRLFDRSGKIIGAVCGAPAVLAQAGIMAGKQFCSEIDGHPVFEQATSLPRSAVRDGHIITGLGARIFHFTTLLIEAVAGPEEALQYKKWAGI